MKSKKLRASARAIATIQRVLSGGQPLVLETVQGKRTFRAGNLTSETRSEDGWLRTTFTDGDRYVWVGPLAFAELLRQAEWWLSHPEEAAQAAQNREASRQAWLER